MLETFGRVPLMNTKFNNNLFYDLLIKDIETSSGKYGSKLYNVQFWSILSRRCLTILQINFLYEELIYIPEDVS